MDFLKLISAYLVIVLRVLEISCVKHEVREFNPEPLNNGKICRSTQQIVDGLPAKSVVMCMQICNTIAMCRSVFFDPEYNKCHRCRMFYQANDSRLHDAIGNLAFSKLQTHGDHCNRPQHCIIPFTTCFGGRCLCQPGYPFNPVKGACVTECDKYQESYVEYGNIPILLNSSVIDYGHYKKDDCQLYCNDQTWCLSFGYTPRECCKYYHKNVLTLPDNNVSDSTKPTYYYQRKCNY